MCEAKTTELRKLIVTHLPFLCDGHAPDGYQVEGEIFEIPDAQGLDCIDTLAATVRFTNAGSKTLANWIHSINTPLGSTTSCGRWMGKPGGVFQSESDP